MSYYLKTCNFTICSIFSNSGHVGWCTASPDTILKLDTLVMIQTKFGFHWSSTYRGEDFWKSLRRTDRRRMPSDGKSSHGLWPGELKRTIGKTIVHCHHIQLYITEENDICFVPQKLLTVHELVLPFLPLTICRSTIITKNN